MNTSFMNPETRLIQLFGCYDTPLNLAAHICSIPVEFICSEMPRQLSEA